MAIPESETRFYLKGADATVEFASNGQGVVTHLILVQDNRNIKAERVAPAAQVDSAGKSTPKAESQPAKPLVLALRPNPEPRHDFQAQRAREPQGLDRRAFLSHAGGGFGALALAHLLGTDASLADRAGDRTRRLHPEWNGGLHHRARATRVVQLFMSGAASQCDTFDFKPPSASETARSSIPAARSSSFKASRAP